MLENEIDGHCVVVFGPWVAGLWIADEDLFANTGSRAVPIAKAGDSAQITQDPLKKSWWIGSRCEVGCLQQTTFALLCLVL